MSLESFYGGKQGISPVIKGSFKYIDTNDPAYKAAIEAARDEEGSISSDKKERIDANTMDLCFLDPNYKDIWYNELCIIDTESKNNSNNGRLYRRTLKGRGDEGVNKCAEYIGQIVGPAGGNPRMEFMSIEDLKTKASGFETTNNKTISYPGQNNQEPFNPDSLEIFNGSTGNTILVPGKTSENKYNDNIKYTWVNFIDDKETENSVVYMGFQIPYTIFNFTAENVSWKEDAEIVDNSDEEHPFYKDINIKIPKGVRGNAPLNFRLVNKNIFKEDNISLYNWDDSVESNNVDGGYSFKNDAKPITIKDNDGKSDFIWVYDYVFYNKNNSGAGSNEKTFFLGNHKEIKEVSIGGENQFINFEFTDGTLKQINLPLPTTLNKNDEGEITLGFKQDTFSSIPLKEGNNNFKLDYIEDAKVLGSTTKAHLFILHSSSYYRVTEKLEESVTVYFYKGSKILNFDTGSTVNNDKPKITFNDLVFVKMDDGKWWQDLGEIGKYTSGIRIKENISYEGSGSKDQNPEIGEYMSYNDYIDLPGKGNTSFIKFLNLEKWYALKKSEEISPSSRTVYYIWDNENNIYQKKEGLENFESGKVYYKYVLVDNPYYGGRFRSDSQTGNWLDEGILWANIDGGSAFFYDYFAQTWTLLGRWEDQSNSLIFSYIDENNLTKLTNTGLNLKTTSINDNNETFSLKLPNIWEKGN